MDKAASIIFPICRFEKSRALFFLKILRSWAYLSTELFFDVDALRLGLHTKDVTDEIFHELITLVNPDAEAEYTKSRAKVRRDTERMLVFLRLCVPLYEKLKVSFEVAPPTSPLKKMFTDLWHSVMTFPEDGRGLAIAQFLELMTAYRDSTPSYVSTFFDDPHDLISGPRFGEIECNTLGEYIDYLWWEFDWIHERPDVCPHHRLATMLDDARESGDAALDVDVLIKAKIEFAKEKRLIRKLGIFISGEWTGMMWLKFQDFIAHDTTNHFRMGPKQVGVLVLAHSGADCLSLGKPKFELLCNDHKDLYL